jgi:cytoskeleton protein RodZ
MDNIVLGELLRETRIKLGLDLEAIAEGTRISPKNLLAIEESNFAALPAEVFTRGFYAIYARCLSLDPAKILEMYGKERRNLPKEGHLKTPPPNRLAQNMKNLAAPPSSLPFAYFGFSLLLLLLFGAFLCWYFSWNPASYLSYRLRSLDDAQQILQTKNGGNQPILRQSVFAMAQDRNTTPAKAKLLDLSSPSIATAATNQPDEHLENLASAETTKYHVNAVFQEETKITLTLDENPQRTMTFKSGEQVSWRAMEKLIITLPVKSSAKISLNEIPLELPKPAHDCITLAIPEYLLR